VTDEWAGIDQFFTPEKEILVASSADDIVRYLREIAADDAREIGCAMRKRALREHTYQLRGVQFQETLQSLQAELCA
jgi:spore maturation protein CgeB